MSARSSTDGVLKGLTVSGAMLFFWLPIKIAALLAVLFRPSARKALKIYATWEVVVSASLGIIVTILPERELAGKNYLPQWSLLRKLGFAAFSTSPSLFNATASLPLLLPVLVTLLLSAKMTPGSMFLD